MPVLRAGAHGRQTPDASPQQWALLGHGPWAACAHSRNVHCYGISCPWISFQSSLDGTRNPLRLLPCRLHLDGRQESFGQLSTRCLRRLIHRGAAANIHQKAANMPVPRILARLPQGLCSCLGRSKLVLDAQGFRLENEEFVSARRLFAHAMLERQSCSTMVVNCRCPWIRLLLTCGVSWLCDCVAAMSFGLPPAGRVPRKTGAPPPPSSWTVDAEGGAPPVPGVALPKGPPPPPARTRALTYAEFPGPATIPPKGKGGAPSKAKANTGVPKLAPGDALNAANLYLLPHQRKNEVLQKWDEFQFNERVLDTLSNDDATETCLQWLL